MHIQKQQDFAKMVQIKNGNTNCDRCTRKINILCPFVLDTEIPSAFTGGYMHNILKRKKSKTAVLLLPLSHMLYTYHSSKYEGHKCLLITRVCFQTHALP